MEHVNIVMIIWELKEMVNNVDLMYAIKEKDLWLMEHANYAQITKHVFRMEECV